MHRFTGTLLAAVGDATAGGLDGVALGCLSAREAGEAVLELHEVLGRLKGLQLALLAHADQLDVSAQAEGPAPVNTAAWLTHRALVSGRTARTDVRRSRDLTTDFTATGSALLAGDIDPTQADIIVTAVKQLPDDLETADRDRAEKVMLAEARRLDADQLRVLGRRLLEVIDPDAAEALEATAGCRPSRTPPMPTPGSPPGTTTQAPPTSTSPCPPATPTCCAPPCTPSPTPAWPTRSAAPPPPTPTPAAAANNLDANRVAGAGSEGTEGTATRVLKANQRVMGEAFCRLIETLDPNRLPHSGGLNATVVVTIPLATLEGGLAAATMDTGTRLSPGEARRMACDAGLIPAVLGARSEVLDHGRTRRLFSKPQRVAMAIRQSFRCAAEGCERPTAWCDAHHLQPWIRDGHTNLDDGVLICGRHHTLAHHPDYTVHRRPGYRIAITRTPRQVPRRHKVGRGPSLERAAPSPLRRRA